jgi:hypothetical protein
MLSQSCSAASGGCHADASTAESIIRLALSGVAETAVPVEKRRRCARADSQIVYLARHGETAWVLSGQQTGMTDLPLTERGERNGRRP